MALSPAVRTSSLLSSSRFSSSVDEWNKSVAYGPVAFISITHTSFTRIDLVEDIRVQTVSYPFEYGGHRTAGEKSGRPGVVFQS